MSLGYFWKSMANISGPSKFRGRKVHETKAVCMVSSHRKTKLRLAERTSLNFSTWLLSHTSFYYKIPIPSNLLWSHKGKIWIVVQEREESEIKVRQTCASIITSHCSTAHAKKNLMLYIAGWAIYLAWDTTVIIERSCMYSFDQN